MSDPPPRSAKPVLVSACLLGVCCRYDGRDAAAPALAREIDGRPVLAVCPEELGELRTPRPPARLAGGTGADVLDGRARVLTHEGEDVTRRFLLGAERTVALALAAGVEDAVLKERSPSCGSTRVHGESGLAAGSGVTAAALLLAGVRVRAAPED